MDILIEKLIKANKISNNDAIFLQDCLVYFKDNYSYLNVKDEVLVQLFEILINKQDNFNREDFKNMVNTYFKNYIKERLINKDIVIVNKYINKLLIKNKHSMALIQFRNFILEIGVPFNKEYYNFLKNKASSFKNLLEELGIDDFDYNLFNYYINDSFEAEKLLRPKGKKISFVIEKYEEILRFTSVNYIFLDNLVIDIKNSFKNNKEFRKIKYILHNYDIFLKIFAECCCLNKAFSLNNFKSYIY